MRRFLLFVLLALPTAARSQIVSVYVTSANSHFTGVQTSTAIAGSSSASTSSDFWTSGVGGGVTLGLLPVGPIHIGLDLRGSTRRGTEGADTAMAGLRIGLKPPILRIKPYVQASGGYVGTRTRDLSAGASTLTSAAAIPTFNNRYAAWEILGGVDYPIVPFLDIRVIEFGGGRGYAYSSTTALNLSLSAGPQISLFTVNTGLVLHF